jgi:prephenate dehydrogenase
MRVTIIGLGLIGGSLGLALRAAGGHVVTGWDPDAGACALALARGAIDQSAISLATATSGADLVVVATPVMAVRGVLDALAEHLEPGTVVSDVSSTKREVDAWARASLRDDTPFIGGHPMAGAEVAGMAHARADLLDGAIYCLTPRPDTPRWAVDRLLAVVRDVNARPMETDPALHDQVVAGVSHLPLLTAAALMRVAHGSGDWETLRHLAASGFRDTTRLASGDPTMQRDICVTNADEIRPWLRAMAEALGEVAGLLDDPIAMGAWLQEAKTARDEWLAWKLRADPVDVAEEGAL